jgi:hypothetical protein
LVVVEAVVGRRYLDLLLDGVRSSSERRSTLPVPALTRDEIERALTG